MTCNPSDTRSAGAAPSGSGSSGTNYFVTPDGRGSALDYFLGIPVPPAESAVPGFGVCGVNMSCNPSDPTESKKTEPKLEPKPKRSVADTRKREAVAASSDDPPVFGKDTLGC